MKNSLHTRLIVIFFIVILIAGTVPTAIGFYLIGERVVKEAQCKVSLDLESARCIYKHRLSEIEHVLQFTAMRDNAVIRAIEENRKITLLRALKKSMKMGNLDMLTVADINGNVIIRAAHPGIFGDSMADDPFVRQVMNDRSLFTGTQILSQSELRKESPEMAERACIDILDTPMAQPSDRARSTSGMVLKSAVPVYGSRNIVIGVMYGGVLLNRNYRIVDTIKDIVYKGVTYRGKDTGTATIFQGDLRISTNVMKKNGSRAVGTRVSDAVFETVMGRKKTWTGRAFVVNDWYITAYEPIRDISDAVIGMLYVGILEKPYADVKKRLVLGALGFSGLGVLMAVISAWHLGKTITGPVQELAAHTEKIADGDFSCRVESSSRDEIGMLADSFNMLCRELQKTHTRLRGKIEAADEDLKKAYRELQQKQDRLVEAEKLASMGQLSAGIAHEINNPLGTILLHAHILLRKLKSDEEIREDISLIMEESERCRHIVRGLLDFGRQTHVAAVSSDIGELIDDALVLIDSEEKAHDVEFAKHIEQGMPHIPVDSNQIKQVLINLLKNSLEAVDGIEGRITCEAGMSENKRSAVIRVADNGRGISKENLSQIFTPFFTTKESEKGTGLGLAIAYGIIKMHSGSITAESEEGKGTVFTVSLPVQGAKTKETEGRNVSPEVKEIHF